MEFAAAPIFLLMAVVAYLQYPPLCTVPGNLGFLSSMWFMYVIMGAVHSSPWLALARRPFKSTMPKEQRHSPARRITRQAEEER